MSQGSTSPTSVPLIASAAVPNVAVPNVAVPSAAIPVAVLAVPDEKEFSICFCFKPKVGMLILLTAHLIFSYANILIGSVILPVVLVATLIETLFIGIGYYGAIKNNLTSIRVYYIWNIVAVVFYVIVAAILAIILLLGMEDATLVVIVGVFLIIMLVLIGIRLYIIFITQTFVSYLSASELYPQPINNQPYSQQYQPYSQPYPQSYPPQQYPPQQYPPQQYPPQQYPPQQYPPQQYPPQQYPPQQYPPQQPYASVPSYTQSPPSYASTTETPSVSSKDHSSVELQVKQV